MIKGSNAIKVICTETLIEELKARGLGVFPLSLPFEYKPEPKKLKK